MATPSAVPVDSGSVYETVACALCGSDEHDTVIPARRSPPDAIDVVSIFRSSGDEPLAEPLVRCRGCGLHYVRPRLRSDLIIEGYSSGSDPAFVSQVELRERTFARCLDRVEQAAKPPGRRIFDVGAAGGSFLAVARKRGYATAGCEPSRWLCDHAREHYGVAITPGTIFDIDLPRESLDLVSLWDVIEHTPDPTAVLKRVHDWMAPQGVLALTYPDYGAWITRLLGRRWPFLLTVHLYYFERRTMQAMLEKNGFQVVTMRAHFQTLELGYVAQRAAPYLGPLGALLQAVVRGIGAVKMPLNYWIGQTMVVAKKV
ncbi:MAG: class I SAM-dependent methyltransferase [Vicinamibacteria bacterium]|nr:class I SAM-dependent methyltransferase [Vicinamibacteria bacterium]